MAAWTLALTSGMDFVVLLLGRGPSGWRLVTADYTEPVEVDDGPPIVTHKRQLRIEIAKDARASGLPCLHELLVRAGTHYVRRRRVRLQCRREDRRGCWIVERL